MVHSWADPAPPLEGGGWGTAAGLAQGEKVTHSILKNKGGNGAQNVRAPFFPAHFFPCTFPPPPPWGGGCAKDNPDPLGGGGRW